MDLLGCIQRRDKESDRRMDRLGAAALGCCLALVLAGCGDSSEMSAAEYFAALEAAGITYEESSDAMLVRVEATEDRIERTREFFTGALAVFETLVSEMESLSPPADVSEAHDEHLANGSAMISAIEGVLEELEGVDTLSEFSVFENSAAVTAFESAGDALIQSCVEVEQAAIENGITLDFRCPTD